MLNMNPSILFAHEYLVRVLAAPNLATITELSFHGPLNDEHLNLL